MQGRAAEPVEPAEVVEPVAAAVEEEDPTQPTPLATFREAVDAAGEEPASRAERALSVSAADLANLQPGVVIERDLGANDRVRLRGLPSAFVATRFAGERMPSPGGIDRTAGLGIIPAEFLSAVRVDTVFSPDSDGDAIAGTFDLVPLSPRAAASGHNTLTVGGTWNTRSEEAQPMGHLVIGGKPVRR